MNKANLLVVDDLPANLTLLRDLLSGEGYGIRLVTSGERALVAVEKLLPDLILLDIVMPGMDGYEVCGRLKQGPARDVPVIFISASDDTFDKLKAFEVGGVDYVSKPFHEAEVLARIRTHCALRDVQKSLEEHNRELALLNRTSRALQLCIKEEDTYPVLLRAGEALLPALSGAVLMVEEGALKHVGDWGDGVHGSRWNALAARLGELGEAAADFSHPKWVDSVMCVPIRDFDRLLGVLAVQGEDGVDSCLAAKEMFIGEILDRFALAIQSLRLKEELRQEAIRDPLTRLYNRRHMEASLEREVHRTRRHGASMGVLMLDVDHFRDFNNTHGHEAGDAVLREMGAFLESAGRGEDIVCRYGGEEFLIIVPDSDLAAAAALAERILQGVRAMKVTYHGHAFQITVSIGVAAFPASADSAEGTVAAADEALYAAKDRGRDQLAITDCKR